MFMPNFLTRHTEGKHTGLVYIGLALLMVVLFESLVFGQARGLGFALFIILINGCFLGTAAVTGQIRQRWPLWLLLPIIILTVDTVLYNNIFVQEVVPMFIYFLTALAWVLTTLANPERYRFLFSALPGGHYTGQWWSSLKRVYQDLFRRGEEVKHGALYRNIAIGILISLPILLVFGALLTSADAVFARFVLNVFTIDVQAELITRIIRIVLFTLLLSTCFYLLFSSDHAIRSKEKRAGKINGVIATVVLVLVNLLFLAFVVIQFTHLFGGNDFVLQQGITYADYARSGFFQLLWVLIFSGVLLFVLYRSAAYHGWSMLLGGLKLMLLILISIIAISALVRMNLYQDTYGFTVSRLYVEWFVYAFFAWVLLTGVSIIATVQFRTYFYGVLAVGLAAVVVLSSFNVDRMIAKENVSRHLAGFSHFDMTYLSELSVDVWPEVRLLPEYERVSLEGDQYVLSVLRVVTPENPYPDTPHFSVKKRSGWREWNWGYERGVGLVK